MGRKPNDYPWTHYPVFIGGKGDPLVETSETLLHFGKRAQRARRNYRAFMEGAADVENPWWNLTKGILGGEEFLEAVLAHVDSSSADEEIARSQRFPREVLVPAGIERVAGFYGEDKERITCRGRGKPEREVAVYVAKALTGKTNRELGAFGGIKGSAVSEVVRRVERKFEKDGHFRQKILKLKDSLVN